MKPKQTKADVYRQYLIPESMIRGGGLRRRLRYQTPIEKGVYWYWFSLEVRHRDVEKWGTCISCGRPITVEDCDAGHFIPAAYCGRDLLFDFTNVNAECHGCNAFDEFHLVKYARNLNKRYGEGTAEKLEARCKEWRELPLKPRDWSGAQYAQKIHELQVFQRLSTDIHKPLTLAS